MSRNRPPTQIDAWPNAVRMTARATTALLGGYGAAAGIATLLARLAPTSRVEASAWGLITSFLLFAGFGLWAFYERRLLTVVMVLWGAALLSAGAVMLLGIRP